MGPEITLNEFCDELTMSVQPQIRMVYTILSTTEDELNERTLGDITLALFSALSRWTHLEEAYFAYNKRSRIEALSKKPPEVPAAALSGAI